MPEPTLLPLAYTAEILFELGLLRQECCQAARAVSVQAPMDGDALEDAALLDDALGQAQRAVQQALETIRQRRLIREIQAGSE